MNLSKKRLALLALMVVVSVSLLTLPIFSSSLAAISQRGPSAEPAPQISYGGEVVYQVHAGKSGRIYPASSNSTTLVLIHPDQNVTFSCETTVRVQVNLCIELAVSRTGTTEKAPVGVQAQIDGVAMYPFVSGTTYLAGYVAQPEVGAVGAYSKLESWVFAWERTVAAGKHTVRFYWAVSTTSNSTRVWGDFYSISVWATKVNP